MNGWRALMRRSDAACAALREKPCVRFEKDPYLRGFQDECDPALWHLWFDSPVPGGAVWMHLVIGETRALLIDTGYGIGDLKGALAQLTDRPVTVVNTHWHPDHTGGNAQFARVWCHAFDAPYLARQNDGEGPRLLPPPRFWNARDLVPLQSGEVCTFADGCCFDLGGRTVEAVHMPGHSAGGCMLLDTASGVLFSGDAVLFTPTLVCSLFPAREHAELLTVAAFADALGRAAPRLSGVQRLCPGHSLQNLAPARLQAMLDCCRAVLAAPGAWERYDYIPEAPGRIRCVEDAMLVYTPDRVGTAVR